MSNRTTRVAMYTRVSTRDKGQDTENQRRELLNYIHKNDWTLAEEFTDQISGRTSTKRNEFKRMMEECSRRKYDIVLVWALDRFTREGVAETFVHISNLKTYGVAFESYTEAHFRTTGPTGDIMIAFSAWVAKQESVRTSERIHAGLAVVCVCKFCGHERHKDMACSDCQCKNYVSKVRLGRAPLTDEQRQSILALRGKGSCRVISDRLGISKSAVAKVLSTKGMPIVAFPIDGTSVAI